MIVLFTPNATHEQQLLVERTLRRHGAEPIRLQNETAAGLRVSLHHPELVASLPGVDRVLTEPTIAPRASRTTNTSTTSVRVSRRAFIGHDALCVIAGPCAVESPEQLDAIAQVVSKTGAHALRGGAFKPRTSPYSFQGEGLRALQWLRDAANQYDLGVVSEVMDIAQLDAMVPLCDVLQIGSRNMQNFALLRAVGQTRIPILLKRGMSATLDEWLLAAEYILDAGNPHVILCERGVRHFDPVVRNLLDLSAVPLLRERTHLPIVVDPSHGTGARSIVSTMACAAVAAGAHGVMVEVHPDPGAARSDGFQALTLDEFESLVTRMNGIEKAVKNASG